MQDGCKIVIRIHSRACHCQPGIHTNATQATNHWKRCN